MLEYARRYGTGRLAVRPGRTAHFDRDSFTPVFPGRRRNPAQRRASTFGAIVHALENVGGTACTSDFVRELEGGLRLQRAVGDRRFYFDYDLRPAYPPYPRNLVAGIEWVEQVVQYLLSEGSLRRKYPWVFPLTPSTGSRIIPRNGQLF